jgi:hypothetical protein
MEGVAMELILYILIFVLLVAALVWLYIIRQGDAEFEFLVDQRTDCQLEAIDSATAVFSCKVPFVNIGTQDGTIMDCYPRHLLPQEQFDAVEVASYLELETRPRKDGYFEAAIVPKTTGNAVKVTLKFTAKEGNIKDVMTEMVDMPVDIVYQAVARSSWYIDKRRITITADELAAAIRTGYAGA